MNFANIDDDTGGPLYSGYYVEWKRTPDEITRYMGEKGHPEGWAEFVISSNEDATAPSAISGLRVISTNAYSANITFTATGDNASEGHAKEYEIRYLTSSVTEANWKSATEYENNFRPQAAGNTENFKLIGFQPDTTYYLGIKAKDETGDTSPLETISFTTDSVSSASDKGFLTVEPGGRYFAWENGDPHIAIGSNEGIPWPYIRTLYDGQLWDPILGWHNYYAAIGPTLTREYLQNLSSKGVNTIRISAEAYDLVNPVYLVTDASQGPGNITFNDDTLIFLQTFLDECAIYDINVIVCPFDTFFYKEAWSKVPFSTDMGGPMNSTTDFFNSSYRGYLEAVLDKLVQTIGDRKNLIAWSLVQEFDSDDPDFGWNSATFDDREDTVNALSDYLRSIDPNHMIYISSVRWDPKFNAHLDQSSSKTAVGSDAAVILNNRKFDFNSTHTYYHDIRDPNHNNPDNTETSFFTYRVSDQDNTVAPAVRIKQGLQFYCANSLTPKPYFNTEFGPIKFFTSEYDQYFTEEDDNQYFHNMLWAHLATGEVGSGIRWPGDMLNNHILTDQMRDYQLALKNFVAADLDFNNFQYVQIGQYMEISNTSIPIVKTGITEGEQGIIFLVKDTRKNSYGDVS